MVKKSLLADEFSQSTSVSDPGRGDLATNCVKTRP